MQLTYLIPASILCFCVWQLLQHTNVNARLISYALFFIAPALTFTHVISPLTGLDGGKSPPWLYGITFLTPFLALLVLKQRTMLLNNPLRFYGICLNPIYMISGPIPTGLNFYKPVNWRMFTRRFMVLQRYAILGTFFLFVAAPGFKTFIKLNESVNPLDTLTFGLCFEFYVYFNFAGYSLIAFALMRLCGFSAPLNFKQPFSSGSIIEYWQRWHASLGNVLRTLFFQPIKKKYGIWMAIVATFMASALWHGITLNFLIWGAFQGTMWCISRWLFLKRFPAFAQYALLLSAIVFGRIIFAEADINILTTKILNIISLNFSDRSITLDAIKLLTNIDTARLMLGGICISIEIAKRKNHKNLISYKYAKKPFSSTFFLFMIILFSGGETTGGSLRCAIKSKLKYRLREC